MNSVSVSVSELFINFGQISKLCSFKGTHQGANPYHPFMSIPHQRPSHPPIPHSVGAIRPYANHFNSRGEMVQLASRPTASMTPLHVCAFSFFPPYRFQRIEQTRPPIRLCKSTGCNAILLPQYHYPGRLCRRCQQAQLQFAPPSAPMQRPPPAPPPPSKSTLVEGDPAIIDLVTVLFSFAFHHQLNSNTLISDQLGRGIGGCRRRRC